MIDFEGWHFIRYKRIMDVIDAKRVEDVKIALLCFTHHNSRRVIAFLNPMIDVGPRLAGTSTGSFQHLALVVRRVATSPVTPKKRFHVTVGERCEEVFNPLVEITIRVFCHGVPIAIENHTITPGRGFVSSLSVRSCHRARNEQYDSEQGTEL